ncbi:MAG: beta-N-acetylhexosaminidase [Candidatus Cyclobacteriaceae bacterium M2_1C_046]
MNGLVISLKSLLLALPFIFISCSKIPQEQILAEGPPPAIIPLPQTVEWGNEMFLIPQENVICYSAGGKEAALWLEELLKPANTNVSLSTGNGCGNWNIILDTSLNDQLGQEGYNLTVSNEGATLKAATEAGLFYAVQTLRQMFPAEIEQGKLAGTDLMLRHVQLTDVPKFSWRGTMVDVSRSFFDLDYLKKHADRMALYKLNRLHLHLTDDQGWRIEIKSKPALTEIGAKSSVTGGKSGYLTQEDYKELQDYALARNIIIIPEIDMPGHIYSALASYPELNCPENSNIDPKLALPPDPYTGHQVGWSKLCLTKPESYDFVSTVIGEVAAITKGPWFHIGGDEIEDPLYEEFVVKADSIVRHYGKTTIGWEEVTKAPVSESLISQEWHGKVESVVDVKVIESICSHFYLDHANIEGQENTNNWCKKTGVSLKDVYSFRSDNPNSIGIEAPVWTEMVHSNEVMDNRFWPRAIAVAEVAWTADSNLDFSDFTERLAKQEDRLKAMGINHFASPEVQWRGGEVATEATSVFTGYSPESNN